MGSTLLCKLLLIPAGLGAVSIHTDFEGGRLGKIEQVAPRHFRLAVAGESDQDGRNRQANWYYFRVDGAGAEELILDMVNLPGEYNYKPNRGAVTKDTPPVISRNGKTWRRVDTFEYDATEPKLRLRIRPPGATFWVAHTPPYTEQHLARLRMEAARHPAFREEVIGKSAQGRHLLLWTIGAGDKSRKTAWLMFRQHSWESGSSWTGEGAVRRLLAGDGVAKQMRDGVTWKILPMCDPDGVSRGGVRFNVHGYDLNRNWDVRDPKRMPEITAQREAIARWLEAGGTVDLLLSLHNTETAEYLEGPPQEGEGRFRDLAERLAGVLERETSFAPSRALSYAAATTTPGRPGRMTVVQGLYRDFGIPAFLMEQRIAFNDKLGRLPLVEDRRKFGGELVEAVWKTLAGGENR